jgi:peroxiredoxin Q/BCP
MNRIFTYLLLPVFAATAVLGFTSIGIANDQVAVGDVAPEFELADQHGQLHSLEDYRDQWVVLYFYPKDDTPGCTTEACEFKAFAENYGLPFPLLADVDGTAATAYGVKTRAFGLTVAKRQTFIIGPDGMIAKHYEKVNPSEHSKEVLADLQELSAAP